MMRLTEADLRSRLTKRSGNKFGAVKKSVDGIEFDSTREARCYQTLKMLQFGGHISNLKCQVQFDLVVNGVKVCKFIADFTYDEAGVRVVADAKGYRTPVYRLKKKLMQAVHGIEIQEL